MRSMCQLVGSAGTAGVRIGGSATTGGAPAVERAAVPHPIAALNNSAGVALAQAVMRPSFRVAARVHNCDTRATRETHGQPQRDARAATTTIASQWTARRFAPVVHHFLSPARAAWNVMAGRAIEIR